MAYASGLWHSLTTSRPRDGLGPKGVFCKRNLIRSNRGQRLGNMRKTTKKHKYFKNKGLDGHKRYDTKITPTLFLHSP